MNQLLTPLIKRQFQHLSKAKLFIHLASTSPRRSELLSLTKLPFDIARSSYQEKPLKLSPKKLVLAHAKGKTLKAIIRRKRENFQNIVLGADTIVCLRGKTLGKPSDMNHAFKMLKSLSGTTHIVYTGIAVYDLDHKKLWSGFSKTRVCLKKLPDKQIQNYFKHVSPLDKAGSYAIQSKPCIAKSWEGSFSNVIGLPLELLAKGLNELLAHSGNDKPKSQKQQSRLKNS